MMDAVYEALWAVNDTLRDKVDALRAENVALRAKDDFHCLDVGGTVAREVVEAITSPKSVIGVEQRRAKRVTLPKSISGGRNSSDDVGVRPNRNTSRVPNESVSQVAEMVEDTLVFTEQGTGIHKTKLCNR